MPWPSGRAGGASSPHWGGYVRVWIRAAIAAGRTLHAGPHPDDRLDAGNVLGGGAPAALLEGEVPATESETFPRLWVDLECDITDCEIAGGATSSSGIFSKADTATLTATLVDPAGIYDPLNSHSPFAYGGHSRLVPGTPINAECEIVNGADGTWQTIVLFTGTADSWSEEWVTNPRERRAKLTASDVTKAWVKYERPALAAGVGAGETTGARVSRLVSYYGWLGTVDAPASSSTTHAATVHDRTAWEQLNSLMDDELGSAYFTRAGVLRWLNRDTWLTPSPPVLLLGCPEHAAGAYDVLVDARPSNYDAQLRNDVYAQRAGGPAPVHAFSSSSITRFGTYGENRTDLTLETDAQVSAWASTVLTLYAFPQQGLEGVTIRPDVHEQSWVTWAAVLGVRLISDLVRIVWAPPDIPEHVVDVSSRVVGYRYNLTRAAFEVEWQLVAGNPLAGSGIVFTVGPSATDRLDAGYVLGFG